MVAGLLGGSGTHIVQIIIAIAVAAALIGYFLLRVGGRRGGVTSVPFQRLSTNVIATETTHTREP